MTFGIRIGISISSQLFRFCRSVYTHFLILVILTFPLVATEIKCDKHLLLFLIFFIGQSGEAVKDLYNQLGEKLELRKPSPAQVADAPSMDLPLPAVPTPTAL